MKPIDARHIPQGQLVEADICIVGGGPAGLSVAQELAGGPFRVCLLESGGLEDDAETLALSEGRTIGNYQISLRHRHRRYGGNANRWLIELNHGEGGVRYTPLDEIDFEPRDWLPYSGWPLRRADLNPFYARAHKVCRIGRFSYEAEDWEDNFTRRLSFPDEEIVTKMFQFGGRTVFTREIPAQLDHAVNIAVYVHANVVEIETDEAGRAATRVRVVCLDGKEFHVAARYFVLAAGGIECARLLLLSDRVQPLGLGNQNDLVGRFFIVHPQFHYDRFTPIDPTLFRRMHLYDLRSVDGTFVMGRLGLSRDIMQREQLLNIGAMLLPRRRDWRGKGPAGPFVDARGTLKSVPRFKRHLQRLAYHLSDLTAKAPAETERERITLERGGWAQLPDAAQRYARFEMASLVEQAPDPNNRVMLGIERDRLGARRLELHWRWSEQDNLAALKARARVGQGLVKAGLGTFELKDVAPKHADSSHHMGTTRMNNDPHLGVVDSDCKVHGVTNLFIASSAVFPTGGFANPTLTIVALGIRLADHLKSQFQNDKGLPAR